LGTDERSRSKIGHRVRTNSKPSCVCTTWFNKKFVDLSARSFRGCKWKGIARHFCIGPQRRVKQMGLHALAISFASSWVGAVITHMMPTSRGGGVPAERAVQKCHSTVDSQRQVKGGFAAKGCLDPTHEVALQDIVKAFRFASTSGSSCR